MESSGIIPFVIWGILGLIAGFVVPFLFKEKNKQIILVTLFPILGSFSIGAFLYLLYESGPDIFDFNGYLFYGLMHLYYGLVAGIPMSLFGFMLKIVFFGNRQGKGKQV